SPRACRRIQLRQRRTGTRSKGPVRLPTRTTKAENGTRNQNTGYAQHGGISTTKSQAAGNIAYITRSGHRPQAARAPIFIARSTSEPDNRPVCVLVGLAEVLETAKCP